MNAILIILIVARGEANDASTFAAVRASYEILGSHVDLQVRELDHLPDDEGALRLGLELHAAATIELSWDHEHRLAMLRYHIESEPGYKTRSIGFSADDAAVERGRTIGFAFASMIPLPAIAPTTVPTPKPEPQATERPPQVRSPADRKLLGSLDLVGAVATGVAGDAGGFGGSVAVTWYAARAIGLRTTLSLRAGEMAVAHASSSLAHGGVGLVWFPVSATPAHPLEIGARVDALVMREELSHFSSDDAIPVRQSRWLPGAAAALEGTWFFAPAAGLTGAMGTEIAFGETTVTLHRSEVTTVPPVRLVWELGVRAGF